MGDKRTLFATTLSHFCVDFACFYLLFAVFVPSAPSVVDVNIGFLLYNALAFGLQPLFGALCDIPGKSPVALGRAGPPAAPVGCCLLLLGLLFSSLPWVALVLAALGNALFHVGGGIDSLTGTSGKLARSGVFVSSGAVGVALGTLAGSSVPGLWWLPLAAAALGLLLTAAAAPAMGRAAAQPGYGPRTLAGTAAPMAAGLVVTLCLVSVVVRAWGGGAIALPWKTTPLLGLLPALAACTGKAAGGFLADRFGARAIGVASLLLSAPLLSLFSGNVAAAVVGLLLFNINMSVTLCAIAAKLPQNPGLSFGITTFGLLCGTVPRFFVRLGAAWMPWVLGSTILLSAGCLLLAAGNRDAKVVYTAPIQESEGTS